MRILLANPALDDGGIGTYATELINALSKDHELIVVLPDDKKRPITAPGVKVLYHDPQVLSKKNALFFINLINEELKPDLVISSKAEIIPVIAPYISNDIRVMTVSHSGKGHASEYSAINHKYLDNIIAASSDYNKEYLERKYHIKDKTKIKVIYNFVARDNELEALRDEKKQREVVHIIYAGGPLPGKNPNLVLQILCDLVKTDLNFKFYWSGGTKLPIPKKIAKCFKLNDVRQFFQEDDRIVFAGRIDPIEEFIRFVSTPNILLNPSRNEGCSMLLLQALRSGSICVVGDFLHSNREIVERGNCGFVVDHHSPQAFVDKLADIITHHEEYIQLYENAHDTFEKHLTYSVWKQSLDELLAGKLNHKDRKQKVSNLRLSWDLYKMKALVRRTIRTAHANMISSCCMYYWQALKMKLKGDFPLKHRRLNHAV